MLGRFLRRLVGAAMLDGGTYEEIEADRSATPQALAVVVLSSLAAGIGLNGARGARRRCLSLLSRVSWLWRHGGPSR